MKIFLISPVREIDEAFKASVEAYVGQIEIGGDIVHWPLRDTKQDADSYSIVEQNRNAIKEADEVRIAWDGKSMGSMLDLGMAHALGKRILPVIGLFPKRTKGKSIQNFIHELNDWMFWDDFDNPPTEE